MTKIFLLLMVAACYNPAGDPNCVAWYRFESGSLTTDSSDNSNTLTNSGVDANSVAGNFKEGASSGLFDGTDMMSIVTGSLSADFPMQDSPYNQSFTVAYWVKWSALPTAGEVVKAVMSQIAGEKLSTGDVATTYTQKLWWSGAQNTPTIYTSSDLGYFWNYDTWGADNLIGPFLQSSGTNQVTQTLVTDRWYHVGISVDFSGPDPTVGETTKGTVLTTVYDSNDQTVYTDTTFSKTYYDPAVTDIRYKSVPFENTYYLGVAPAVGDFNYNEQFSSPLPTFDNFFTGFIDDVVWFSRPLSQAEILLLVNQDFDPGGQIIHIGM